MNKRLLGVVLFLGIAASVRAEVSLPAVFSDHMVVQAEMPIPIFGQGDPGEPIAVELAGKKKTVTTGADGKWMVKLESLQAGGPFELKVAGRNTLVVKDVLVGEVWLASGQSNMRFPLSGATGGKEDAARADLPKIRYSRVPGKWQICSPKTASNFSAVAFHFAVELQARRKVPMGIIENSVSGELGQNFISPEALKADPELAAMVRRHTKEASTQWQKLLVPIIPYGIRGVLWYQGEGNRDYPVTYRRLLPALIGDWRRHWGQGDFPFLVVQLANYQERKQDPWEGKDCALREAQLMSVQKTKNTALVVTIDLGIAKDVHYPNKKPVGERLARAARAVAYGESIEHSGPIFANAKFEAGQAVVSFEHVGGGLVAKGDRLTGFLLCGADRKFLRAEAKIDGDRVIVTHPMIAQPVAVRYGWERNPDCNLYNRDGLPASPFRSDDFVNYSTKDLRE